MERHEREIKVKVVYTGHDEFEASFSPETTVGTVKLAAMNKFGIEGGAAPEYALEHDGAKIPDGKVLGAFGKQELTFKLVRTRPQEKGNG